MRQATNNSVVFFLTNYCGCLDSFSFATISIGNIEILHICLLYRFYITSEEITTVSFPKNNFENIFFTVYLSYKNN